MMLGVLEGPLGGAGNVLGKTGAHGLIGFDVELHWKASCELGEPVLVIALEMVELMTLP